MEPSQACLVHFLVPESQGGSPLRSSQGFLLLHRKVHPEVGGLLRNNHGAASTKPAGTGSGFIEIVSTQSTERPKWYHRLPRWTRMDQSQGQGQGQDLF